MRLYPILPLLIFFTISSVAEKKIGTREVPSTPLTHGEIFAAPNANSNNRTCTKDAPCTLERAVILLNTNRENRNVLFLRGGTYPLNKIIQNSTFIDEESKRKKASQCKELCGECLPSYKEDKYLQIKRSGTEESPIIIESYPGEWAILDGENSSTEMVKNQSSMVSIGVEINRNLTEKENIHHVYIRKLEIKGARRYGIRIRGDHNRVEGCKIHHNFLEGISIAPKNFTNLRNQTSFNTISDNRIHHNSDANLFCKDGAIDYLDGEQADGISITAGAYNTIEHNEVYSNSDDGIDTYYGNYTKVRYNLVHHNGRGENGNGNGIKTGGCTQKDAQSNKCDPTRFGLKTNTTHNISYENIKSGFTSNSGTNPIFKYNTAYKNRKYGFHLGEDSEVIANVALENQLPPKKIASHNHKDNSWQKGGDYSKKVISKVPLSSDFLRLKNDSPNIGAYTK
jgi:parallel beta-helix repeat protein